MVQYPDQLDRSFGALSDATRRKILLTLGAGEASVTELAHRSGMSLTGFGKHVAVLEEAGLVTTEKVGRVRTCRLGPRKLQDVTKWMAQYAARLEERLDHLEQFLERTKEQDP